jgi:hypothetical protein
LTFNPAFDLGGAVFKTKFFETNLFSPPKAGGKQSSPAYGGLKCMVLLHSTNIIAALRLEKSPNSR